MVSQYIAVGLGGAIGAVTRIAISRILPSTIIGIPFQLLIINSIGCLAMGILSQLAVSCWITSDNIKDIFKNIFLDKKRISKFPKYIFINRQGKPIIKYLDNLARIDETILKFIK